MAAMKPRTGDGPLEAVKEGKKIVMRVPRRWWWGGLVVELSPRGGQGARRRARSSSGVVDTRVAG